MKKFTRRIIFRSNFHDPTCTTTFPVFLLLLIVANTASGTTSLNRHVQSVPELEDHEHHEPHEKSQQVLPNPNPTPSTNDVPPPPRRMLREGRQFKVHNEYERFYLCMFTLWTNPNCRNPNQQQGQGQYDLSGGTQFNPASTIALSQPTRSPNPLGGPMLGLGNGIFGGRFGMNPLNHQTTFFGPGGIQYPVLPGYYPPIVQNHHNNINFPYPDPQVNRRPGVPRPVVTSSTSTTSTSISTTPTTPIVPPCCSTTPTTTTPTPSISRRTWSPIIIPQTNTLPPKNSDTTKVPLSPPPKGGVWNCQNLTQSSTTIKGTVTTTTTEKSIKPPLPSSTPELLISTSTLRTTPSSSSNDLILQDLTSQLSKSLKDLEESRLQNRHLQDALSTLQGEKSKLKSRISQLERTNDHLQKQNGQLQHTVGDQRMQMNEIKNKGRYVEEKLVRLTRQTTEDQKQLTRLQNRVRDLNKDLTKCRDSLYQSQLQNTQRFKQKRPEVEQDSAASFNRHPEQVFRDDLSSNSSSEESPQIILEFSGESDSGTTLSPEIQNLMMETTVSSSLKDSGLPVSDQELQDENELFTTVIPSQITEEESNKKKNDSTQSQLKIKKKPDIIFDDHQEPRENLQQQPPSPSPPIIFDDNSPLGAGVVIGDMGMDDDDSNELSPNNNNDRSIQRSDHLLEPAFPEQSHFNLPSFSQSTRPDPSRYWPYRQFWSGPS